jgi:exopolysaccharide biosynthesis polyprenyl glycosylphosphotransferase
MFLERAKTLRGSHAVLDGVCICIAFGLAFVARSHHDTIPLLQQIPSTAWHPEDAIGTDYALLLALSSVAWILGLRTRRGYLVPHRGTMFELLLTQTRGLLWAVLAASLGVFTVKLATISRLYFGYYFVLGSLLILGKDLFMRSLVRRLSQTEMFTRHTVIVASGKPAAWFAQVLQGASESGYRALGVVWPGENPPRDVGGLRVLGGLEQIDALLVEHPIDEFFIVGSAKQLAELAPVIQQLTERGRVVSVVTTLQGGSDGIRGRITEFSGVPVISYGPMPKDEVGTVTKRILDVSVSAIAIVALLPVMFMVALLIKLFDPGPVLFAQDRLGLHGEPFRLYKFRTMRVDAEQALRANPALYQRYLDNDFKLPEHEDPRVSRLGHFLRRSSLDELPQLYNVLMGTMSLVGPRPIVPDEIANYQPYSDLFLMVRPGVTGLWQVSGRSNVRYPERAFMDLDYIGKNSISKDVRILLRTLPAVLARKGAH